MGIKESLKGIRNKFLQRKPTPKVEVISTKRIVVAPREKTAVELAKEEAEKRIRDGIKSSSSMQEFMLHHLADASLSSEQLGWAMVGIDYTTDNMLKFAYSEKNRQEAEEDAKAYEELASTLDTMENRVNTVKVAIKRVRDEYNRYHYRVLAKFPPGVKTNNHFYSHERDTIGTSDIVFLHPTQACSEHALDDLYKEHRRDGFYVPYMPYNQALSQLEKSPSGIYEYQLTPRSAGERAKKQNPNTFLLATIGGAFQNEPNCILVSQFKKR